MNTKYIYKISNYLFICMLALAVFACKDDDNSEDTSALTLVSSNITEGATLESNSGYDFQQESSPSPQYIHHIQ